MDRAALGSRLKEARLAKKLTQTEVVGNFITRNMLSQIESGTATPSIKTLTYLAEVLDLPVEQLIGAEEPGDLALLQEVKQALRAEEYEKVLEKAEQLPDALSDERAALLAQANLRLGERCANSGELPRAVELIGKALEHADTGVYANETIRARALLMMGELAKSLQSYYQRYGKQ